MVLYKGYDAAFPPTKPYPGTRIVGGYLGGATPHEWTRKEWERASAGGTLRSLGIWTGYLEGDPIGHANEAIKAAESLGWRVRPTHDERLICLDKETQEDRAWVAAFARQLAGHGFLCLEYRSLSAIEADPSPLNVWNWAADWNVPLNLRAVPREVGQQIRANVEFDGTTVDLSVFTEFVYDHCHVGLFESVT